MASYSCLGAFLWLLELSSNKWLQGVAQHLALLGILWQKASFMLSSRSKLRPCHTHPVVATCKPSNPCVLRGNFHVTCTVIKAHFIMKVFPKTCHFLQLTALQSQCFLLFQYSSIRRLKMYPSSGTCSSIFQCSTRYVLESSHVTFIVSHKKRPQAGQCF